MNHTHAIITYAKTHYLLTAEQEQKLRDVKSTSKFVIDGSMIMGSNIAEVMTIQKYYETYPDKRPQITDRFKGLPDLGFGGVIKLAKGDALKGMIKGLKNYINSDRYQGGKEPLELLKQMEDKLRGAESMSVESI